MGAMVEPDGGDSNKADRADGAGDDAAGGAEPRAPRRLSTREAADRLGVKPETLYAYVSRGLLGSVRAPGGRGSTFDPAEVDALADRSRRTRPGGLPPAPPPGAPPAELRTGITLIGEGHYWYRGVDAVALAGAYGYEAAAEWLWTGRLDPATRFTVPPTTAEAATRAAGALPAGCALTDRLRAAVVAAAAADPLRFDLAPAAVLERARGLVATMVAALPLAGGEPGPHPEERVDAADGSASGGGGRTPAPGAGTDAGSAGESLAGRLWRRLTTAPPDPGAVRALDAALVLLMDHDLAASTFAARVAASARAHPYAVVSAGLAAMDGPLHGAASGLAHRMLGEVLARGAAGPVVADQLRAGHRPPGLGHRLYPGADPRATALFALLDRYPAAAAPLAAAREVERVAAPGTGAHANVDLALAVLSVAAGMPAEAGEVVFGIARTAGWIAHALEEYGEPPLRLRRVGGYTGLRPPVPLPRPEGG
jgi:citrate synthase